MFTLLCYSVPVTALLDEVVRGYGQKNSTKCLPRFLGTLHPSGKEESSLPSESEVLVNLHCHPSHCRRTLSFHLESERGKFWSSSCPFQRELMDFGYLESKPEDSRKKWGTYHQFSGTSNSHLLPHCICYYLFFRVLQYLLYAVCPGFICTSSGRYRVLQITLSKLILISALTKYGNKELHFC